VLSLPRASGGAAAVVIDPQVWNNLCSEVERVGKLADNIDKLTNVSVSDPLTLDNSETGIRLGCVLPQWMIAPVRVEELSGAGLYVVSIGRWNQDELMSSLTPFDLDNYAKFDNSYYALMANIAESGLSVSRIGVGTKFVAWKTSSFIGPSEVWATIYNHAVRFIRQNPLTLNFESTAHDATVAAAVPDDQWEVWATAQRCTTTPTATLMQLMNPGSYQ
jgi:hypothetical protein